MNKTTERHLKLTDINSIMSSILRFIRANKTDAYLVGGAVRDACLKRTTEDLDLIVSSSTQDVGLELAKHLDGKCISLDAKRNIQRIVFGQKGLTLDVSYLHQSEDVAGNLSRRDFTIDAMAISLNELSEQSAAKVIDPTDGYSDLLKRSIRATSEAALRADPVRILRGVRLSAQLDFSLETKTITWMKKNNHLLSDISIERVRDEILKILASSKITQSLYNLDSLGLLSIVIPELETCKNIEQPKEHSYDVFRHSLETPGMLELILSETNSHRRLLESVPRFEHWRNFFNEPLADGVSRSTMLRLAALLHDIAKPCTKTVDNDGRIRFLGHGPLGSEISRSIMSRLRFSRKATDYVSNLIKHHLRPSQVAPKGSIPSKRAVYRYYRDLGNVSVDTVYLNLADYMAAKGDMILKSSADLQDWQRHCKMAADILDNNQKDDPDIYHRIVNGYDLMSALALEPGPIVGKLICSISEAHAAGDINNRQEAIDFARALIKNGNK